MEIKVGMEVFLEPCGNNARRTKEIRKGKIKKIGRKYLYVSLNRFGDEDNERLWIKFNLEDRRESTEYTSNWKFYFSEQEILEAEEKSKLDLEFYRFFSGHGANRLTLPQLRRIKDIIDDKEGGING